VTPSRWLAALLGVAIVANVLLGVDRSFAQSEARRWRTSYDSLTKLSARVDTVYRERVRTLTREVVRLDTLTRTVEHWKHDTLRVVEYVERADSTVKACLAVVQSCDERHALDVGRIAALEAEGRALAAQRPTWKDRLRPLIIVGGLSYLAGKLDVP
jgi:hypothetical protein